MDARTAIIRFCNFQERSQQEVRDKLYALGQYPAEVERQIAELIESGLLNEERFAKAYARGKFRLKRWGKVKIIQGLKRHRIAPYLIQKALKEIDPSEYFATALRLGEAKWQLLRTEKSEAIRKLKLRNYLLQKGYESSVIAELLTTILASE
jgi:regulatory protein